MVISIKTSAGQSTRRSQIRDVATSQLATNCYTVEVCTSQNNCLTCCTVAWHCTNVSNSNKHVEYVRTNIAFTRTYARRTYVPCIRTHDIHTYHDIRMRSPKRCIIKDASTQIWGCKRCPPWKFMLVLNVTHTDVSPKTLSFETGRERVILQEDAC